MNAAEQAFAFMLGVNALVFTVGYFVGRFGERRAIANWLWELPTAQLSWSAVSMVEHGKHRSGLFGQDEGA